MLTSGKYQFAGGGAGDDATLRADPRLSRHRGLHRRGGRAGAAVDQAARRRRRPRLGARGPGLRVTEADGMRLVSLNGLPAVEAFEEHARRDRPALRPQRRPPVLPPQHPRHRHRRRAPPARAAVGQRRRLGELARRRFPPARAVHIMKTTAESAVDRGARRPPRRRCEGLRGATPGAALFFDCVATRLRMGEVFGFELDSVAAIARRRRAGRLQHLRPDRPRRRASSAASTTAPPWSWFFPPDRCCDQATAGSSPRWPTRRTQPRPLTGWRSTSAPPPC